MYAQTRSCRNAWGNRCLLPSRTRPTGATTADGTASKQAGRVELIIVASAAMTTTALWPLMRPPTVPTQQLAICRWTPSVFTTSWATLHPWQPRPHRLLRPPFSASQRTQRRTVVMVSLASWLQFVCGYGCCQSHIIYNPNTCIHQLYNDAIGSIIVHVI